jgi:hypothetical protein
VPRLTVVRVKDDGAFVTVKWPAWIDLEGYESTHRPGDLVRPIA